MPSTSAWVCVCACSSHVLNCPWCLAPTSPSPVQPPWPCASCQQTQRQLNARADIRNYLLALTGQGPISIADAAAVELPCTYQPGNPQIHGACDVGAGVGYDFVPFTLLSTPQGLVNLCSRGNIPASERITCPGASVNHIFQSAVATSYFKMSKMYVDAAGKNAGAPWGVVRQPCQVRYCCCLGGGLVLLLLFPKGSSLHLGYRHCCCRRS